MLILLKNYQNFKIYDANSSTLMNDFKKNQRKISILWYKFELKKKKIKKA